MRRIAAIVLPNLACELVRRRFCSRRGAGAPSPFGVVIADPDQVGSADDATAVLAAADEQAWQYGARPGQRVAEATAYVGRLTILRLSPEEIRDALGQLAELALGFGTTAAVQLKDEGLLGSAGGAATAGFFQHRYPASTGAGPWDTVWLDITGCAHLRGGEELLCDDLRQQALKLGCGARVAVAAGPRIAQALARWSPVPAVICPPDECAAALARLPIAALPLTGDLLSWLGKLGILRIADLARLDRAKLAARLGPSAGDLLELIAGRDSVPLLAYQSPRLLEERVSFEHELHGTEPLLFVLGGLVARAAARLQSRGEACSRVTLELTYDRSYVRLRQASQAQLFEPPTQPAAGAAAVVVVELPLALHLEQDLLRTLRAKLERLQLRAPVTAVQLVLDGLVPARRTQLDLLSRRQGACPDELPVLLAELSAWLGPQRTGVLRVIDSHRPEARSQLAALEPAALRRLPPAPQPQADGRSLESWCRPAQPTRLLPTPVLIPGPPAAGQIILTGQETFSIAGLQLDARIDGAQWWTGSPVRRDYAYSRLQAGGEHCAAWLFKERGPAGRSFLHGWYD